MMSNSVDRGPARYISLLMTIILFLCLPAAVSGQVIDDFEAGPFTYGGTVADSGNQTSLLPIHCIASTRWVTMTINGSHSQAQLNLFWPDDEVATVWGDNGGRLQFDYYPVASDLTFGNVYNAVRVRMPVAEPGGALEVVLGDGSGVDVPVSQPITGPGDYVFEFSQFPGINAQAVEFIELNLSVPDFGDYHISDFRATDTGTAAAMFDVTQDTAEGPPYPSEAIQMTVFHRFPDATLIPVHNLEVVLHEVTNGATSPMTMMMAMDSGGAVGMPGEQVAFTADDLGDNPPLHRSFDLRLQATSIDPTTVILAMIVPPDPVLPTQFSVQFTTYVNDSDGASLRRVKHLLGFELPDGSSLGGIIPCVMPGDPAVHPNSFHVHFDVEMAAQANGEKAIVRAFEILLAAEILDYPSTTGVSPQFRVGSLGANVPNPFNPSTEIRFDLVRETPVRLTVHDLAGRMVGVLAHDAVFSAGPHAVVWDGRDQSGRKLPSGSYLVKLEAGSARSTRKIMLLK